MYKILIIEDNTIVANVIKAHLEKWEYKVEMISDFRTVMEEVGVLKPHLILLDISLPFYNGFYWCNEIRKLSKIPIVFISSAVDNMNVVMAMNMGGDDFIAKPFDLEVLTAKITALLRRTYSFVGSMNYLEHNQMLLNLSEASISYQDKKVELTKNDIKIMQILLENAGKIVTREAIMVRLWESDNYIDDNTLTVNVTRLRKKLETIGLLNCITTKKGIGYMVE